MSARQMPGRWLAIAASVVVAATLVVAVLSMGAPSQQREARLDARRVQDLQEIERAVQVYFEAHNALPESIATAESQPGWSLATVDPTDGTPYSYVITGERSYKLCASFTTDTAQSGERPWTPDGWNHGVGEQCFGRKVAKPTP